MALDDDAFTRALLMAGFGMMGAQNGWQGLSRGGMFGLQGYDQALEMKDKRKLLDAKLLEEQQQAQARTQAMAKQDLLQKILSGSTGGQPQVQPAGSQRSVVDAPDWKPQVAALPPAAPRNVAQMLLDAGFDKEAKSYAEAQGAIHGEAYGGMAVTKDGKPYYMTKQGPRYVSDGSFVPREALHFADTGAGTQGLDQFTGAAVGPMTPKVMSPAEKDASARGWATFNRGDLKEVTDPNTGVKSFAFIGTGKGGAPQVVQTGATPPLPDMPAAIRTALAQNDVTLGKVDRAMNAVDENPAAFGLKNMMGDSIRQRTDPGGVEARALVADIGSQKLHDRSGAAVTVSEAPRLVPFIPNVNDSPETIKKKLGLFRKEYAAMHEELSRGLSINAVASPDNRNVGTIGQFSGAQLEAEAKRRGLK